MHFDIHKIEIRGVEYDAWVSPQHENGDGPLMCLVRDKQIVWSHKLWQESVRSGKGKKISR